MKRSVLYVTLVSLLTGTSCLAEVGGEGSQVIHQDIPGVYGTVERLDQFGYSLANGDFNRDGFRDLAVGVPFESIGSIIRAGAVQIFYGSDDGLLLSGQQLWNQNTEGLGWAVERNDVFGFSLASADFDNDGFDDLVIGVPGDNIEGVSCGSINILYGTGDGLTTGRSERVHQDSRNIAGGCEVGDGFGTVLTTGYFNQDPYADLAIGIPSEAIGNIEKAGAVAILYGGPDGLGSNNNQLWHQNSSGIKDRAEADDKFGWSLASGDFDGDGQGDLAIGVPYEDVGDVSDAGLVHVLYGKVDGLSDMGDQIWHQDMPGVLDRIHGWDNFGYSLAAGDFNNSGQDDLAIGIPEEERRGGRGVVSILYGSPGRLTARGDQMFAHVTSEETGVKSLVFGTRLLAAHLDDDNYADLVVMDAHGFLDEGYAVGAVHIYKGAEERLATERSVYFHRDFFEPGTGVEKFEFFGWALTAGDFDQNSANDIAVSTQRRRIGDVKMAGQVNILYSDND